MPVIYIEFDDTKVSDKDALDLSNAIQKIVSSVTQIEDVCVYANSSRINVKIAPIEIFVHISAHKIPNIDKMLNEFKQELSKWKKQMDFPHPINLTLNPLNWKFEIGI